MRTTLFLLIITAVIFQGCADSRADEPADPRTEKFLKYLGDNFDDSIPEMPHYYFLVAKKDSKENIYKVLSRLKSELKEKKKETFGIIYSVDVPVPDSLISKGNSRTDWNGAIEKLGFNFAGVAVIKTCDHRVTDMLQLTIDATGTEKKFLE